MMMMMMDDSGDPAVTEGESGGRGSRGGAVGSSSSSSSSSSLSVNKVSSKIGKGIRRPAPQPLTVYKTGPEGFRNLVQELTGAATSVSSHEVSSNNARPPPSRTPNNVGRLQNLAPPPLVAPPAPLCTRPSFSHARPPHHDTPLSPQRFPPLLSPLSFSPLAADNVWACNGLESPASASIRHLAQLVAGGACGGGMVAEQQQQHSTPLCVSPSFPLSPSFPPCFTSSGSTLAQAGYSLATVVGALVAPNSSPAAAAGRPASPPPPDFSFPGSGGA